MTSHPTQSPESVNKKRRRVSFLIKIIISAVALYFVFRKIDVEEALQTLSNVHIGYFILALAAFNLSKLVAALRFKAFLKPIHVHISDQYNIRLLYIGMFYNLFLPGSISGDGYKIYLLKQQHDVKTKHLVSATLLDRVSGLVLLVVMAGIFLLFSSFSLELQYFDTIVIIGILLSMPAYFILVKLIFPNFLPAFLPTSHHSFWVQTGQVVSAVLLLVSLSVSAYYLDYLTLFMISSVVAVLPFTIGGVGARELVFLYGFSYLNIDKETAITFTILFFLITALTSLAGLFVASKEKKQL
ncbi:lysylphosphatidylglycerol synthase transmembrane domain-containing protein [Catalinimonas niigatensis]|uniref:lysylphosphatidylglycerol synthase transmembrane domain-containing protein n=1 Tax=Catalinimonas niigatensis TaxID=1397264 RepID=UPI0026654009|nr:lysylphosphatidylglycerol synthase transmembrane domain-containing protein [Catalinimonas niigatensis]WPP51594.1 lysylphosphatidylglycerol synthase transmembrane domain-containing protein [Catalinimonas niigatensis]